MTLGEVIRESRERLGWTQTQLAERVGVTPSFITKIEKDEAFPSYDRLLALANLLVLDREQLLSLTEQAKQLHAQERIRTRGSAVRGMYGLTGEGVRTRGGQAPSGPSQAEQIGREVLADPDLQLAFTFLRAALADPDLRSAVLKTLEVFAREAKPARRE